MNRAKQIRIERNLGVVDVVKGAQISHRSLKKVENGDDVHPAVLARLSTFYEIKASELLAPAHFDIPKEAAS
jgi:transcriptional regulator with XRE-family HTH domain